MERARHEGRLRFDLTVTNPTRVALPYDEARILAALSRPAVLDYEAAPLGHGAARRVVAERQRARGLDVADRAVVLTASTSEAYGLCFKLLCDPGDEVLVPSPSYPLFDHLAALDSVRTVPYPLVHAGGEWVIDLSALRARVSPRTRAVVLVSPNNPTGSFVSRAELAAVAALGLPVVSDEVFTPYPLEARADRAGSALEQSAVLTFSLGGLSKEAALPQVKLAWMVVGGPPPAVDEALGRLEVAADAYLSPSASAQVGLEDLLACTTAPDALRRRVRSNLRALRDALADTAATVLAVEGGWSAIVRLPAVLTEDDWAHALLEQDGVLIQPGWFFDVPFGPHAVVSLITPEKVLTTASALLAKRLAAAGTDARELP